MNSWFEPHNRKKELADEIGMPAMLCTLFLAATWFVKKGCRDASLLPSLLMQIFSYPFVLVCVNFFNLHGVSKET